MAGVPGELKLKTALIVFVVVLCAAPLASNQETGYDTVEFVEVRPPELAFDRKLHVDPTGRFAFFRVPETRLIAGPLPLFVIETFTEKVCPA